MQRFRKFIDRSLNVGKVKDTKQLSAFGIACATLPDPPEEFDEFEFKTVFSEDMDILMGVAIELGTIKRILFGLSDKNDPDSFKALSESQLQDLLAQKGDQFVEFFEYITQ